MASTAVVNLKVEVSGLGISTNLPIEFTHSVAPAEVLGPSYAVIGSTADTLELGHIAPADVLGILIIARVDTVGIIVSADCSETPSTTVDNILLDGDNNESVFLSFAGGLNASGGIRVKGDETTAAIEYFIFAKQT